MEPGRGPVDLSVALTAPDGAPVRRSGSSLDLSSGIDSLLVRVPEAESWEAEHPRL